MCFAISVLNLLDSPILRVTSFEFSSSIPRASDIKFNSSDLETKFYIRIRVKDQPGVLSKITSYFNEANISVEKILQFPDNNSEDIPILITTHKIKSSKL